MKISDMHWTQVEQYLKHDDRAVVPLGSTEQHAYLSMATDSILAERVAIEAAEPLGVPVFPVLAYGITPGFMAYPGTVHVRVETYLQLIGDVLDSLKRHGFRRILFINGHGGNQPAVGFAAEWSANQLDIRVKVHNWWNAPKTMAAVRAADPVASHASWMENFPWTRLAGVAQPTESKLAVDFAPLRGAAPELIRASLGDGNCGGLYQRPDEEMLEIWRVGVEETREAIGGGWI